MQSLSYNEEIPILEFSAFQLFFMSLSIVAVVFGILYLFVGGRSYIVVESRSYEPRPQTRAKVETKGITPRPSTLPHRAPPPLRTMPSYSLEDTAPSIDLTDIEVSYRVIKERRSS